MHHRRALAPVRRVSVLDSSFGAVGDNGDCRALSGRRGVGLDLGLRGSGGLALLSGVASDGRHARQALDPGLVLRPDLDAPRAAIGGLGMRGGCLGDQFAAFFLKSAWALRSASGCKGRVFCQDKSSLFSSFDMPFSL